MMPAHAERPAVEVSGVATAEGDTFTVKFFSKAAVTLLENGHVLSLSNQSHVVTLCNEETVRLHNLGRSRRHGTMRLARHWLVQIVPVAVTQENPFELALDCTRAEAEVASTSSRECSQAKSSP